MVSAWTFPTFCKSGLVLKTLWKDGLKRRNLVSLQQGGFVRFWDWREPYMISTICIPQNANLFVPVNVQILDLDITILV